MFDVAGVPTGAPAFVMPEIPLVATQASEGRGVPEVPPLAEIVSQALTGRF